MKHLVIFFIKIYRNVSPYWKPSCCRFHPSCSAYALEVVKKYGVWKGFWLTIWRLVRCHPWGNGGHDPVL